MNDHYSGHDPERGCGLLFLCFVMGALVGVIVWVLLVVRA